MTERYRGNKVLIIGGGISGKGAKSALEKCGAECDIFDESYGEVFPDKSYDLIVISPAVKNDHYIYDYARERNIPIIGEIELGFSLYDGTTVAVTGTNGKTTTVSLIGEIFSRAGIKTSVCGNIGVSFADCAIRDNSTAAVVEVSSFQLESIKTFRPHIACILNITPDHLDRHKTMKKYAETKLRIAENQDESDYMILSQDEIPLLLLEDFYPKSQILYVSLRGKVRGAYMMNNKLYYNDEFICDRDCVRLRGNHNIANALAAICVCRLMGIDRSVIVDVLTEFDSGEHRLRYVDTACGKNYYNDSKGTNIGATLSACAYMPSSTCLILGGSDKGYEFDELFEKLPENIKIVYAIGETASKIRAAAYRNKFYEIEFKESLAEAVKSSLSLEVDNVLLSPATASFDMFSSYKERGEVFERLVRELKKQ